MVMTATVGMCVRVYSVACVCGTTPFGVGKQQQHTHHSNRRRRGDIARNLGQQLALATVRSNMQVDLNANLPTLR